MTDPKRFTQADLLNAMGLKVGDKFVFDDSKDCEWKVLDNLHIRNQTFSCDLASIRFLNRAYTIITPPKYTLTETEKHIVLAIDEKWKWLTRSASGYLEVTAQKPNKTSLGWGDVLYKRAFDMFHHHFQFIQWSDEEPVSLDELRDIAKK